MLSKERSKLMEHLMCCVCLDTVKDPKLCPACSKMFCFSCIRQCFTTSKRCPLCRHYVRDINQFINCHWVEQLAEDIDSAESLTTCSTHPEEQLSLYCNDCKIVICSNCVLFGIDHENHEISSFKEVCQYKQDEALEIKSDFEQRLKKIMDIQKDLHLSFHKFTKTRDKCFQQMHKTYSESLMLLYDSGRREFSSKNQILQEEIDTFNVALHELKEVTKAPIAVEALEGIEDTLANLHLLQKSDPCTSSAVKYEALDVAPSLDRKVLENAMKFGPPFSKTTVCLHNFTYLSQNDKIIHSSSLNFCNLSFKLEVHTGGLATDDIAHKQIVSLFVILTEPKELSENSVYDFCVEIVAVNQFGNEHANKKSVFLSKFGSNQYTTIPVPDFILKLDSLNQYGYVKQDVDCMVLRFSMRPISYQTLSKIQEDYIGELKKNGCDKRRSSSSLPRKSESSTSQNEAVVEEGLLTQLVNKLAFPNPLVP